MKNSIENGGTVIAILTISAISILLSVWSLSSNSTNKQRINTAIEIIKNDSLTIHGRDSLIVRLNNYQFKEDFYDKQLDIQSNWFIAFVTILFAMFGFFGYSFFVNRINEIEKKAEENRQEQEERIRAHEDEFYAKFEDLESEINSVMGNSLMMQATNHMTTNSFLAFDLFVYAVESFLKSLRSKDDIGENYDSMQTCLDSAVYFLGKIERTGNLNELEEEYVSGNHKVDFEKRFEFLLTNLPHQKDKKKVIEMMKTFDRLCDKLG